MVVRNSLLSAMCVAGLLGFSAGSAKAQLPAGDLGAPIFVCANTPGATTGDVSVTFTSFSAADEDILYLLSPATGAVNPAFYDPNVGIFNNMVTAPGTTLLLGSFPAGTEMIFGLHNVTTVDLWTNVLAGNSDGFPHAITSFGVNSGIVNFEDLPVGPGGPGTGNADYNDLNYTFSNVCSTPPPGVPEPGVVAFGVIAAGSMMGLVARKRKKA